MLQFGDELDSDPVDRIDVETAMTAGLEALFAAIRSACSTSAWSQGVELARAGAVQGEREDEDSWCCAWSRAAGWCRRPCTSSSTRRDWSCDCASRDDVCEHVAAAVIALRQARRSGASLPGAREAAARIGYA